MSAKPAWLRNAQEKWTFRGQQRPPFAIEPGPGQESAWDYPRPPALVTDSRTVIVKHGDTVIAESTATIRVCETAGSPAFYIPPQDVDVTCHAVAPGSSFCEWKGPARYWRLNVPSGVGVGQALEQPLDQPVGRDYPEPMADFALIGGYFSFYPGRIACFVDGERVVAQAGGFYGGWITADVVGPFKGDAGTSGW